MRNGRLYCMFNEHLLCMLPFVHWILVLYAYSQLFFLLLFAGNQQVKKRKNTQTSLQGIKPGSMTEKNTLSIFVSLKPKRTKTRFSYQCYFQVSNCFVFSAVVFFKPISMMVLSKTFATALSNNLEHVQKLNHFLSEANVTNYFMASSLFIADKAILWENVFPSWIHDFLKSC